MMTRGCAWEGCSRAFESNATRHATRDAVKLGLMPFEIARKEHRIWATTQECGGGDLRNGLHVCVGWHFVGPSGVWVLSGGLRVSVVGAGCGGFARGVRPFRLGSFFSLRSACK